MTDERNIPNFKAKEMRDAGQSFTNQGMFEANVTANQFSWINDYALKILGYTMREIIGMTFFDLVPKEHQEVMRELISDMKSGRHIKRYMWPCVTSEGKFAWWHLMTMHQEPTMYWSKADLLSVTDSSGMDYAFMCAMMGNTNASNHIEKSLHEFKNKSEEQITDLSVKYDKLNDNVSNLKTDIANLNIRVKTGTAAAERAANAALGAEQAVIGYKSIMEEEFSKQTGEILKLIDKDRSQDKNLRSHEKDITAFKEMTKNMTTSFETSAKNVTNASVKTIETRAKEEGKHLSRRIVIPVGTITAIITILQIVISKSCH